MRYFKRKADLFLKEWKDNPRHYPLIVNGAMHIGKTTTIRNFAQQYYENVIEINFYDMPQYKNIIKDGFRVDDIVQNIEKLVPEIHFAPGKTLLFFDDIQMFPDIMTSLKSFAEDNRYDVICAGLLLRVQYPRISNISVGYKTDYRMHSMDFEEFLWAVGYKDNTITNMLQHMLKQTFFSSEEYSEFSRLFALYCKVNGMPELLTAYKNSASDDEISILCSDIQDKITNDAFKYTEELDKTKLQSLYCSISKKIIERNISDADIIYWLEDVGIAYVGRQLLATELPLRGNCSGKYKLYAAINVLQKYNIAAELAKQGYDLYYKDEDSIFYIRSINELIPVGTDNISIEYMESLIENNDYIHYGIYLSDSNIKERENIIIFPYFCTFLLKRYIKEQDKYNKI